MQLPTGGFRLLDTLVSPISLLSACLPIASLPLLSWTQITLRASIPLLPPNTPLPPELHAKGRGDREESWVAACASFQGCCLISSLAWAPRHLWRKSAACTPSRAAGKPRLLDRQEKPEKAGCWSRALPRRHTHTRWFPNPWAFRNRRPQPPQQHCCNRPKGRGRRRAAHYVKRLAPSSFSASC